MAVLLALGACGDGNPFTEETTDDAAPVTDTPTEDTGIPERVQGALDDFSYDPDTDTLTITGLLRDGDTITQAFGRNAALDEGVYEAYTFQDDPLDEHTTVYVRRLGQVEGAVAVTGGQFSYYSGGTVFRRNGEFDPIIPDSDQDRGLASYAGEYIGLSNLNGPNTDLLTPTTTITDESVLPSQAGVVNGQVLINVEFGTNNIAGEIYDRQITIDTTNFPSGTNPVQELPDLVLVPTDLTNAGTFAGNVELSDQTGVGEYAGTIGGPQAETLAGAIFAEEHFGDGAVLGGITGEEEYGIFVLGRCSGPQADANPGCVDADPE